MPEITLKDGHLSAVSYVQCTRAFECQCGHNLTITMDLPEGVTYNGAITVDANCPLCNEQVVIAKGLHYIEDYKLLTR